jgi:hypothetical protein
MNTAGRIAVARNAVTELARICNSCRLAQRFGTLRAGRFFPCRRKVLTASRTRAEMGAKESFDILSNFLTCSSVSHTTVLFM